MRWRFLESYEPFTFFLRLRPGAHCDIHTFDVCVWMPGARLDMAPTLAHLLVGFLLQLIISGLALRRPESRLLNVLGWVGVPLLAVAKEVYDGFTPFLAGPVPVGGSGFSFLDLGFTLLGQLLLLAVAVGLNVSPRIRVPRA